MEALTTIVSVPSTIPQKTNVKTNFFLQGQLIKFPISRNNYQNATKLRFLNIRAQASGTINLGSDKAIQKDNPKDENVAFVAGATGRVGSRAVRELLKLGFRVRAGVRSTEKAQNLVQSVKQMSSAGETQSVEKLEIVECDLEKKDQIGPALGNASVVLCCIGASEKEIFDITGPYRIDYLATKNLIEAATFAKVDHFILLTSLGTNKFGFPAAILNLFWGVLIWKRKAEEALLSSGLPYTIVRPGGMERPTDAFKETHNITLSQEDTLFGGLVSNLQVAELMACMARNRDLSYCKVVEVVAETTAPLTPMEKLLKKIPSKRAGSFAPKEPVAEPKPSVVEETAPQPLSPYTAYEDLKPPTSPSPTKSTASDATKATAPESITTLVEETKVKSTPLSPYTAYEDLKPPTSPSPTPSGSQKPSSSGGIDAKNLVIDGAGENGPPQASNYQSPSPVHTTTVHEETQAKPKPRPSSPYTMYEDLKPPTSPTPSTPSTKS